MRRLFLLVLGLATCAGQVITTVAGGGGSLGDNGAATSAALNEPSGVAVDSAGNIYIADHQDQRVRTITFRGIPGEERCRGHAQRERDENEPATPGDEAQDLVERIRSGQHDAYLPSLPAQRLDEEHEPDANPVLFERALQSRREAGLSTQVVVVVQVF